MRRATIKIRFLFRLLKNFYPRSPCGERRDKLRSITQGNISIHALLAESDGGSGVGSWPRVIFLSTLSLRRATSPIDVLAVSAVPISIHALLAESDDGVIDIINNIIDDFYPRSPCGERLAPVLAIGRAGISIHALLAESDESTI